MSYRSKSVRGRAVLTAVIVVVASCGEGKPKTDASSSSTSAAPNAPTAAIVETVLKGAWEHEPSSMNPKASLTLNTVQFGTPYKATAQEVQVGGLPEGATVTPAIVDFTVRTYYDRETQALKRVREATVYIDKMGEWRVVTGSPVGDDVRTTEPLTK